MSAVTTFPICLTVNVRYGKKSKRLSPTAYPKEQLEKFSHYVFGVDYAVIMGILEMKKGSDTSCRE